MFLIRLFIGLVLGTNISLILYALILVSKKADKKFKNIIEMR